MSDDPTYFEPIQTTDLASGYTSASNPQQGIGFDNGGAVGQQQDTNASPGSSYQYGRAFSLVVGDPTGNALDLSQLRCVFHVQRADLQTPPYALVRVYNPAPRTVDLVLGSILNVDDPQSKGGALLISAGYVSNQGVIFYGTIVNAFYARESQTDTYLQIQATDSDAGYNLATINRTLAAGHSPSDLANAVQTSMGTQGVAPPKVDPTWPSYAVPRGRAMYGMARDYARNLAASTGKTWSIQDGALQFVDRVAYLPGDAVVLNSNTGLIGMPQLTVDGIVGRCLLNVALRVNRRLQINQADIVGIQKNVEYTAVQFLPTINQADGYYRVLGVGHVGDTRGNDWYTNFVVLNINDALPYSDAVKGLI